MTGTGRLIRLILRQDRVLLPIWVLVPVLFPVVFVAAFRTGFPTPQALQAYADTSIHTKAFAVTYGVLRGSSLGELVAWRSGFVPVVIALCSLLMVIRHTRRDEEAGRRELVSSTVTGRHADLAAAVVTACAASVLLGVLTAVAVAGTGLAPSGSWALGLGIAGVGCAFAAIGGVVAQLTTGTGAARGIGILVLGGAFLLRGVGDLSAQSGGPLGPLSWLSPISWASQMRPFSGERWWVLLVVAAATAGLTAVAVALSARRDIGGGLFAARLGPADAAPGLHSPLALAWRLHRGTLIARVAGFAVVGLAMGGIAASIGDLLQDAGPGATGALAALGGRGSLIDQYFQGTATLFGVAAAGLAIQSALQLRAEETSGRAEALLAGPVDRLRWAAGHAAFALLGPTLGLVAGGATAGLAHGIVVGDVGGALPRVLDAMLLQLPAVWVFAALAFALFGVLPRLAAGAFTVMLLSVLLGWVGGELQLARWLIDLSVFAHLTPPPGGEVAVLPLSVLTALAAVLLAAGAAGLRRRDLTTA